MYQPEILISARKSSTRRMPWDVIQIWPCTAVLWYYQYLFKIFLNVYVNISCSLSICFSTICVGVVHKKSAVLLVIHTYTCIFYHCFILYLRWAQLNVECSGCIAVTVLFFTFAAKPDGNSVSNLLLRPNLKKPNKN